MTNVEKIIWLKIRKKQLGYIFRRQYSVGPYIVDFYCPKKRLVIEIDGNQHANSKEKEYDNFRTDYFKALNIKTIRFWNKDIIGNMNQVITKIQDTINTSPSKIEGE